MSKTVNVTQAGPADPAAEAIALDLFVQWLRPRLAAELGAPVGTIGERGKSHAVRCRACGKWRRAPTAVGQPARSSVICGLPACIAWLDAYEARLRVEPGRVAA